MTKKTRTPTHPGQAIMELYMRPLSLSVTAVAQRLGVSRKTISRIVNGQGGITPDMALRLSRAFETSPDVWMNLQKNYDLSRATRYSREWEKVKPFHPPRGKVA